MDKNKNALAVLLENNKDELKLIAPKYVNVNRLIGLALEAYKNPTLAKCTPASVVKFCKSLAEAGTDRIGAGGMWAVPFRNNKTGEMEIQSIPDWRLLIEKARRAKVIKHGTAEAVYEKDVFSFERGLNPSLIHKPTLTERGELIAVYFVYTLPDGSKDFVVMGREEIDKIKQRSKARDTGPWVTDYAEMAKKTVVKRGLKVFEGASPELANLIDKDNAVIGYEEQYLGEPIAEPKPKQKVIEPEPAPAPEPEPETPTPPPPPTTPPEPKPEPKHNLQGATPIVNPFVEDCADCKTQISSKTATFSKFRYGRPLCFDCQKKAEKARQEG